MKYPREMTIADLLAIALLIVAAVAFWLGNTALAKTEDLKAFYWLAVGFVTVRAAVQIVRPRAKA